VHYSEFCSEEDVIASHQKFHLRTIKKKKKSDYPDTDQNVKQHMQVIKVINDQHKKNICDRSEHVKRLTVLAMTLRSLSL